MFSAVVITCSDKASKGLREDVSGEYIKQHLIQKGFDVKDKIIISDDLDTIKYKLLFYADNINVDLIITTGGTGFSPRDNTPEATKAVILREVPGISEMCRMESLKVTKKAFLSRGVSGIRERTLIINLPGSIKGVKDYLALLDDVFDHGLKILKNVDQECG